MTNKPTIKDSLLLCASDLQHSAIYDNHIEMQSCIRAVADRITALASVIDGVGRAALAAPAQPIMCQPPKSWNKRGQDAYRRGWEDRGNSVTSLADRYLEGCRDGYAQRDAEVMGALA